MPNDEQDDDAIAAFIGSPPLPPPPAPHCRDEAHALAVGLVAAAAALTTTRGRAGSIAAYVQPSIRFLPEAS